MDSHGKLVKRIVTYGCWFVWLKNQGFWPI